MLETKFFETIIVIGIIFNNLRLNHAGGTLGFNTWKYEMISLNTYSSDPNKINLSLSANELSVGLYGLSGSINISIDLYDDTMFEFSYYRSNTMDGEQTRQPPTIRETLSAALNRYYKPLYMDKLRKCSPNAPYFTGLFKAPFEAKNIIFDNCLLPDGEYYTNAIYGYYSAHMNITGPVHVSIMASWNAYNTV